MIVGNAPGAEVNVKGIPGLVLPAQGVCYPTARGESTLSIEPGLFKCAATTRDDAGRDALGPQVRDQFEAEDRNLGVKGVEKPLGVVGQLQASAKLPRGISTPFQLSTSSFATAPALNAARANTP